MEAGWDLKESLKGSGCELDRSWMEAIWKLDGIWMGAEGGGRWIEAELKLYRRWIGAR